MIDSEQEDRPFYFSVYITKDDKYQVEECSPALSTTCLTPMLERLNSTNNFAQFVRAMRKQFKESVAK